MGDAQTGTGNLAWVTWGLAALGAHLLLLWSAPNTPVETVLAASTTVAWENETWEALAPSSPASDSTAAEPAAIAAPMPAQPAAASAAQAPRTRSRDAVARTAKAPQHNARAAAAEPSSDEAGAVALDARGEDAQGAAASQRHGDDGALSETADTHAAGSGTRTGANGAIGAIGANGQGTGALLRGPRLLATNDPCAGFFPGAAQAKHGQVQLSIDVDAQGHPHPSQTLLELPLGQGFESAAKACAAHLHFAPALDAQGHPVSARARIALRFERS